MYPFEAVIDFLRLKSYTYKNSIRLFK